MVNSENEKHKCAPSKNYTDGSCISLPALKEIVNKYNDNNNDKIDITLNKKDMVNQMYPKYHSK